MLSLEEKGDKLFRAGVVAPFPTVLGEIKFTGIIRAEGLRRRQRDCSPRDMTDDDQAAFSLLSLADLVPVDPSSQFGPQYSVAL